MPYKIDDLKNIHDYSLPLNLHAKIIRKIYFLKFRAPLVFLAILSAVNLASSGWYLFSKASEMETFSIAHIMFGQFELSFDYLAGLFGTIMENAPINLFLPFAINLILMFYLIYLIKIFSKVEKNLNY